MKDYEKLLNIFSDHLQKYRQKINLQHPIELYEPENYILSLGGKRIRPLFCLIACDLFDKDPALALDAALSVELFHNFSLIHDDILDKAPLRRGKPTVHEKWNTGRGILSGDVMLVKSFDCLSEYEPLLHHKLHRLFVKTAVEVCEGQQLDINFENRKAVTVSEYIDMITFKTAVLLACSLNMGALIAGASNEDAAHLYQAGKQLGIAFQIMDDLLDAFPGEEFGKQPGGDIIANKKTILLLSAFELSNKTQSEKLIALLALPDERNGDKLKGVMDLYHELNLNESVRKKADEYTAAAISHLSLVKASEYKKKQFEHLAINLLNRQF